MSGRLAARAFMGLVALVFAISACNGSTATPTTTVTVGPGAPTTAPTPTPTPTAAPIITLKVAAWTWTEPKGAAISKTWLDAFQAQHPNIRIQQVAVPYASYDTTIATQLGTSAAPDVVQLSAVGFGQAVAGKALAPLDSLIDNSAFASSLLPQNDFAVFGGSRYAYIWSLAVFGMFYNKNMLAAAGLPVPTTFDQFMATAKALTDKSKGQYGFAMRSTLAEASGWFPQFSMWVLGHGAHYTNGDQVTINTPEMKQAVTDYIAMYKSGSMLTGTDAATYRRAFAAGKIGMTFDNGLGTQMASLPTLKDLAWAAPTPFNGGTQLILPIYLGISATSQNKEAAAELVKFWLSQGVQDQLAVDLQGELPATFNWDKPSAAYSAYLKTAYWVGPLESKVAAAQPAVPAGPLSVLAPQIQQAILNGLSKVQAGQTTVDQMLIDAQAQVEAAKAALPKGS